MGLLIIKVLLAHFIGDFVLQPSSWVEDKKAKKLKSGYLYAHVILHAFLLAIFLSFDIEYLAIIGYITLSHLIIDGIKVCYENEKNKTWLFFIDQILHIAFILIVLDLSQKFEVKIQEILNLKWLSLILCLVVITKVSSVLIGTILSRWDIDREYSKKSLKSAGLFIGYIERVLIFTFVVFDIWSAIGFLIAAKSVFRFGDLSKPENRKVSEYFLIGTLLSFILAILAAVLFRYINPIST